MYRVRVNRDALERSRKTGEEVEAPIMVEDERGRIEDAAEVSFPSGARMVYRPDDPLQDGTRVWVEAPTVVILR